MQKDWVSWQTQRLPCPARVLRWGHYGRPVLIFPTAGGDLEEIERHGLVGALSGLIDEGRIKVYSVDSIAGSIPSTSFQSSPTFPAVGLGSPLFSCLAAMRGPPAAALRNSRAIENDGVSPAKG